MILVIAEHRNGKVNRASWETIAAAQALAGMPAGLPAGASAKAGASTTAGGLPIKVAVLGASTSGLASELAAARITEVLVAEDPALEAYTPDGYAAAIQTVVDVVSPSFVLMPHTYQTSDCAPMVAARLRKALMTDVTGI